MSSNNSCDSTLTEPLLVKYDDSTDDTTTDATTVATDMSFLKLSALLCGACIAELSQCVLASTLWNNGTILLQQSASSYAIVWFSLQWSAYTCLMVFSGMYLYTTVVSRQYFPNSSSNNSSSNNSSSSSNNNSNNEQDKSTRSMLLFQLEAHFIVSALIATSLAWLINDAYLASAQLQQIHPLFVLLVVATPCVLCLYYIAYGGSSSNNEEPQDENTLMMPTYRLLAATLGVTIGLCSQLFLSFLLWKDNMATPFISNVVGFSLLWSALTVLITFVGCLSLRFVILSGTSTSHSTQLTLLRMEATYISCSLIGICIAWILIDLLVRMPEQIVPSVLMLAVSLGLFQLILRCFPESSCLDDDDDAVTIV